MIADALQRQDIHDGNGVVVPTAAGPAVAQVAAEQGSPRQLHRGAADSARTTMVCFHVAGTAYCIPVEFIRSVRPAAGLVALPEPAPDIAGVVPGDPPLTVVAPLGADGSYVLVVAAAGTTFGLLVDGVTRLLTVDPDDVGPAPGGQHRALVSGTVHAGGQLLMIADPVTMVERL